MRCSKCGTRLTEGEVFCPECGIRIAGAGPRHAISPDGPAEAHPGGTGAGARGTPPVEASPDAEGPEAAPTGERALTPPPVGEAPGGLTSSQPPEGQRPRNSGFAVASLILGIVGLSICPLVGAILALIFGLFAKGDIRRSRGTVKGSGMATAGITLAIIGLAIPVVFAAVAIPLGIIFVRSELRATGKILDGASAARIYYFEHGNSYRGMHPADLRAIEDSVEFRVGPGREPNVVYIEGVTDQSARLYCFSSRNNRYTAVARGEVWHYSFRFWSGTSHWLNDWSNTDRFSR